MSLRAAAPEQQPLPGLDQLLTAARELNALLSPQNVALYVSSPEGRATIETKLAELKTSQPLLNAIQREVEQLVRNMSKGLRLKRWGRPI